MIRMIRNDLNLITIVNKFSDGSDERESVLGTFRSQDYALRHE